MKNLYFIAFAVTFAGTAAAQSFFDDFESYAPGDYIGANSTEWTTWSGATGGSEDAQVVTTNAHSGTNAIYFQSTATNGGPQDVVLPLEGTYNVGTLNFESWFFVETGRAGYFNFQKTATIGQEWALDVTMETDGTAVFANSGSVLFETTYPMGQWFHLEMNIDLSTNNWQVSIDGVDQGSFSNPDNQVALLDIFPTFQSRFYVDDIGYTYSPVTLPALNAAVLLVNSNIILAGQTTTPEVTVRNLGTSAITSFDVTVDYNGTQYTESVSGVNLASLEEYTVAFNDAFTGVAGANAMTATVSAVNGNAADDNPVDDVKTTTIDPVVPAPGKIVVAEEGTGTWCQWCPRGAVAMDRMANEFGEFFAGIAVHNGSNDPMVNQDYDSEIASLITGYPSALVDRWPEIDPGNIEMDFLERITVAPKATISNRAVIADSTGELLVTLTYHFQQNATAGYRVAMVLTEDSLSGTGSGWAQANAYAGGGNGEMGGYENLPNPVPGSMMVYNHVARIILPGFEGKANSFSTAPQAGDSVKFEFTAMPDAEWNLDQMHIIGLLIDENGDIDNASHTTINEVLTEMPIAGVVKVRGADAGMGIFPNPATDKFSIAFVPEDGSHVQIRLLDMTGKQVFLKDYGKLSGAQRDEVDVTNLSEGIYFLELSMGTDRLTQKVVVQ